MGTLADTKIKSPLFARKQAGGVFTVVNETLTTGNIFYVDSGATTTGGTTSSFGRSPDAPFTTLASAITNCTASNGDMIFLMPGHAETTSAIALNKAGVSIIGLGVGDNRPIITASTAASDLIDLTGGDCHLENFILTGAASGVTALIDVASDDNTFKNMVFRHGAAPVNAITVASGARNRWIECRWLGTADEPDYSILFESASENACKDFEVIDCIFNYGLYGLDNAAISNASNGTVEGGIIKGNIFSGMVLTAIDFNSSSSAACRGIACNNYATAYAGISIATIYDYSSYGGVDCRATDAPAAGSPPQIPTATAD